MPNHAMRPSGPIVLLAILSITSPVPGPALGQETRPVRGDAKGEPEAIHLSGAGDRASKKLKLSRGLAAWTIKHDGRSNFKVQLLNDKGEEVDLPVNEIGRYDGTRATHIPKDGAYRVQVLGDGNWTIDLAQPRPATAPSPPREFKGQGRRMTEFFTLEAGSHVFEVGHRGPGIFRVWLMDAQGKFVRQVVGVIGDYEGSKTIKVEEPGIHVLNVIAEGDWSVSFD